MKRQSMLSKFIKSFIVLIVIPMILISIILNMAYKRFFIESYSEKVNQTLEQISIGIENELNNIYLRVAMVAHNQDILSCVSQVGGVERSSYERLIISNEIDSKINSLFNYSSNITSVVFFLNNGDHYYFKNPCSINLSIIKNEDWYQKSLKEKGKVFNIGTLHNYNNNSYNENNLSFSISPSTLGSNNDVEMIYFVFRTNIFNSIYSKYKEEGITLISNEKGEIIVCSDKELSGEKVEGFEYLKKIITQKESIYKFKIEDKKKYAFSYFDSKYNWNIINIIDNKIFTKNMNQMLYMFIFVIVLLLLLYIVFLVLFFKEIIRPINSLIIKMKKVENGNFDDPIAVEGGYEIVELENAFNRMIYKIKELIKEKDLKEKERSKEEIKALQAQIQPHFIYNTLSCIRLMAIIAKVDGIKNMTNSFMELLSAIFKHEDTLILINDEVEYLKHYIYIMKVRFGDIFDVEYNLEEGILNYKIIKLILQPVVENSILHGVRKIEERGKIKVKSFKVGEDIIFEISDNGIGMTEEKIIDVKNGNASKGKGFNNIGIMNVDKRLKLNYGEQYGISIESKYLSYTKVKLIIPIIKAKGGFYHV